VVRSDAVSCHNTSSYAGKRSLERETRVMVVRSRLRTSFSFEVNRSPVQLVVLSASKSLKCCGDIGKRLDLIIVITGAPAPSPKFGSDFCI